MAYVKTTWQTGDVITAEKLNNIEDGVEANADAFVAPEVTAADQGKVLTVDSSGEWAAESLPAAAYELEAHCSINPQTMSIVDNSFVLDSGDMAVARTNYEKSRMIVHLIVVGTEYEYAKMILFPNSNQLENAALQTDEKVGYSNILPLGQSTIGMPSVVYSFETEAFTVVIVKLQIAT